MKCLGNWEIMWIRYKAIEAEAGAVREINITYYVYLDL